MSVTAKPYLSTIPFVNIEEVQVVRAQQNTDYVSGFHDGLFGRRERFDPSGWGPPPPFIPAPIHPGALDITVQLSNERLNASTPPQLTVGNFIYFTYGNDDAQEILDDPAILGKYIRDGVSNEDFRAPPALLKLVLNPSEFQPTGTSVEMSAVTAPTEYFPIPIRSYKIRHTARVRIPTAGETLSMFVASFREHSNVVMIGNVCGQIILQRSAGAHVVPETSRLYTLKDGHGQFYKENSIWPGTTFTYIPPNRVKPYISPLEVSRDSSGTTHGMFSFDLATYISTNSSLSGIITNQAALLSSVDIQDIIIYQKSSGPTQPGNALTPTALSYCGLDAVKGWRPVADLRGRCEILNTLDNGNNILNISFVDATTAPRGRGFAEYKVEILLVDRAEEVVANVTTQLNNMISEATDRLRLRREDGPVQLYARTILTYLNLIEYLFGADVFSPYTKIYWRSNMMAMMYGPQEGDQEKMLLIAAIESFIQQLNNLIQKTTTSTVTPINLNSKIESKRSNLRTLHHTFGEKLYLQDHAGVGLGYIDESIQDLEAATPQISYLDYISRIDQEVAKYVISTPFAPNRNAYGFLSPDFFALGPGAITNTTNQLSISNEAATPLLNSNLNTNLTLDTNLALEEAALQLDILRSSGVSLTPLSVSLKKEVLTPELVQAQAVASSQYLSANSAFYLVNLEDNQTPISYTQYSWSRRMVRNALKNSELVATLINQTMLNFIPIAPMANTESLPGSIAVVRAGLPAHGPLQSNAMTAITKFGEIAMVQYLNSYDQEIGVKQQNWTLLDKTTFDQAQADARPLVCRIKQVTNTINMNPAVQLSPMASYFVLGPVSSRNFPTGGGAPQLIPSEFTTDFFLTDFFGQDFDEILYSSNTVQPHG
jgi:hypothetical protein